MISLTTPFKKIGIQKVDNIWFIGGAVNNTEKQIMHGINLQNIFLSRYKIYSLKKLSVENNILSN